MLGHKLVQQWAGRFEVFTTLRSSLHQYEFMGLFKPENAYCGVDAADFDAIERIVKQCSPDVIVNAIGVIKQLPSAKDEEIVFNINSIFPHKLAMLCQSVGTRLIAISTDCVFNGKKGSYKETDTPDAKDLYGQSKFKGEVTGKNCLTIRTSIIGRELGTSHSLVDWFLSNRGGRVKGFTRAIYSGFPTIVLADVLADVIENHPDLSGLYHVSSQPINKFELLCLVREAYHAEIEIEPFDDLEIDRSLNSDKFRAETAFIPEPWPEMIARMANDQTPYDEWRKRLES
jgi:dTDP-4-dehydrorhamnose reductase